MTDDAIYRFKARKLVLLTSLFLKGIRMSTGYLIEKCVSLSNVGPFLSYSANGDKLPLVKTFTSPRDYPTFC